MNSDVIGEFPRVSAQLVQQASQFQPTILADVAGRRGALHGRIQPLRPQMKLAGPAFTAPVKCAPATT